MQQCILQKAFVSTTAQYLILIPIMELLDLFSKSHQDVILALHLNALLSLNRHVSLPYLTRYGRTLFVESVTSRLEGVFHDFFYYQEKY